MADRLVITIDGDSSGLNKSLQSAENRLNSFNQRVTNSSRQLTRLINQLSAVGASMNGVTLANQRAASSIQNTANRLNQVGQSSGRATTGLRNTAQGVNTLNGSFRNLILSIYTVNTLFFAFNGMFGGLIGSIITANSKMERMNVLLKNMSTGATEAERTMMAKSDAKYLWDLADNAPFKIDQLTETFVKLKAAGIDPTNGSLKALTDAVAYFGGNSEQMGRAGVALSQMLSKGKVTAEELRQQLGDAIPNAMKDMAQALNMTIPELDKQMRKGLVLSADAVPKLLDLWTKKYGGAAESLMGTWDGLMARMSNAWQQTIIRITSDGGSGSLFNVLKTQMEKLTSFLSSKDGDQFLSDVAKSLGTIATVISNSLVTLYQYRDTIMMIGKAMLTLWGIKTVVSIVGSLTSAFFGLVTLGPRVIATIASIATAARPAAAMIGLLGGNAVASATSLGVLNAAGQISIGTLGRLAVVGGGLTLALGVMAGAFFIAAQRGAEARVRYEEVRERVFALGEQLKQTRQQQLSVNAETGNMTVAQKNALTAVANLTGQVHLLADAYGRAALEAKRMALETMRADIIKAGSDYTKVVAARDKKVQAFKDRQSADRTVEAGVEGGMDFGGWATKKQQGKQQADAWESVRGTDEQKTVDQAYRNLNQLRANFIAERNRRIETPKPLAPISTAGGGGSGGKGKADPLGDLDGTHRELVNLIMATKQFQAEAKGTSQAFDENRAEIERSVQAEVEAIKSKDELNKRILQEKEARGLAKQAAEDHRKAIEQLRREQEQLTDLQSRATDQNLQAADALEMLEDDYNGVANAAERYANKLRNQYKEALSSNDAAIRAQAEAAIKQASYDYSVELLAKEALAAKERTQEIMDGLLTEDQAREVAYQREIARVDALIEAAKTLYGPSGQALLQQYYAYKNALERRNKIESNPFAKWSS